MTDVEFQSKCKQRFKGIENFLRRVAFNLGNSPSQTEVKIVSCIPIDITDLQKKINSLEKQLEDARKCPRGATIAAVHQEYRPESSAKHNFTSRCEMNDPDQSIEHKDYERCCLKGSKLSCTCAAVNKNTLTTDENDKNINIFCDLNENNEAVKVEKKKDLMKNDHTHLIYYAQTINSPFNNNNGNMKSETRDISNRNYRHNSFSYTEQMIRGKYGPRSNLDEFTDETSNFPVQARCIYKRNYNKRDSSNSYLEHMIRRQYEPRPILDEFSNSTFSSPICRDNVQNHTAPLFDFDSCSCCHGTFHNIDNLNHSTNNMPPTHTFNENFSENSTFYDTSLYDMVPVKEIPTKLKKNGAKKITGLDIIYPPTAKAKSKINSLIINYHTLSSTKLKTPKISPTKVTNNKEMNKIVLRKHAATATSVRPVEEDISKSCCVDLGNIYVKPEHKKPRPPKTVQTKKSVVLLKNAECLATNVLNIECQTIATQSIQMDDDKTEETLNQIKTILQSVLTEVKTNTQIKNSSQEKDTKDAVVQKGTSRGYVPDCSDLMHSYKYSTYNMNPCSRLVNSSQHYSNFPYNSMKYMHNFPVFIQTPNRNVCSSYYRNTSHLAKTSYPKPAITAATNTDNNQENSKETEKLIKEIYKSIALNLDMPTKDTSLSENDNQQSDCISISQSRHAANTFSHSTGVTIKSIPKTTPVKNTPMNTSLTPLSTNTFTTNQESNTVTMQSHAASTTDTDHHLRKDRIEEFVQNKKSRVSMNSMREYEQSSEDAVISEYTEPSDEESEQDIRDQQTIKHHKEKKNIFTKMFKSVNLFKNKKKREQPEHISESEEEEEENDSDYQTIYSQEIDNAKYLPTQNRSRKLPHSKISYSRQMQDRYPEKRVASMNQEYMRQWTEQLKFHDDQPKNFSEQTSYLRDTNKRKEGQACWQNYETRNATIERNKPAQHSTEHYTGDTHVDSSPASKYVNVPRRTATKGLTWFKKHKPGIHCGEQWKKIILEG